MKTLKDFDIVFTFPNDLDNPQVQEWMNNWMKQININKTKEKRELRVKKINELNAKHK